MTFDEAVDCKYRNYPKGKLQNEDDEWLDVFVVPAKWVDQIKYKDFAQLNYESLTDQTSKEFSTDGQFVLFGGIQDEFGIDWRALNTEFE